MQARTRAEWKSLFRRLLREGLHFGLVGSVGFVVDVGLFNILAYANASPLHASPVMAKVVSVGCATAVTWAGNRYFVFRHRRGLGMAQEALRFLFFSVTGMGIAVGTLWFSHHVLGFTSQLADNIAANVIGLGLATTFRFVTYRTFVFRGGTKKVEQLTASTV